MFRHLSIDRVLHLLGIGLIAINIAMGPPQLVRSFVLVPLGASAIMSPLLLRICNRVPDFVYHFLYLFIFIAVIRLAVMREFEYILLIELIELYVAKHFMRIVDGKLAS